MISYPKVGGMAAKLIMVSLIHPEESEEVPHFD
jgi:hypothetical protein